MTPEHTALVARLVKLAATAERESITILANETAAAIRALSGEVERQKGIVVDMRKLNSSVISERDTLRAERDNMKACWDAACHDIADRDDKLATLRAEVERLLEHKTTALTKLADSRAEVAALKDLLSSIRAYKVIDAEVIGWIDAALADKQESHESPAP